MKKIYILVITLVLVFLLLVSAGFAAETERTLTLPSEGLKVLSIDCGAGRLDVTGAEGLQGIEVRAVIDAERTEAAKMDDFIKDHIKLSLEKRGDRAVLLARIEEHWGFVIGGSARIDLMVRVPKNLALEIDDSSGEMVVEDIGGDVVIDDSSGEIRVARLGGRLDIDDSSGDIDVREVAGDIAIDDGSGDIDVLKVGGSIKVDDGSGDITIDGVGGDVLIEDSGSGDVRIDNVKGRVIRHDIDADDDD
jgi:DUF4097 and DUF4098 domain-containing protein YvlB